MDNNEFTRIRQSLGKTQRELAQLLCTSTKAIQSYEQGWRQVPSHIERGLFLLLSLDNLTSRVSVPCWEIKNCPIEWREKCIVSEYKIPYFCWLINGTFCQGEFKRTWDEKIEQCNNCKAFQQMVTLPPI